MGSAGRLLPLVFILGCEAPPESPERDEVGLLLRALRDDDPLVRDRAAAALGRLLPGAAPAVGLHADDADPEVSARCRALLHVPPDDWTWYRASGLTGIDLQTVDYLEMLNHWCGNAKWEARAMLPKLRSLRLHPAGCLPLMLSTTAACPDHGLPLFRITADEGVHDRVAAELDLASEIREGWMIAALRAVARRTETDFALSRDGELRFRPARTVFDLRWDKPHHDRFRPDDPRNFEALPADRRSELWEEAGRTPAQAWTPPR